MRSEVFRRHVLTYDIIYTMYLHGRVLYIIYYYYVYAEALPREIYAQKRA